MRAASPGLLAGAAAIPLHALRAAGSSSLIDRLLRGRAWVVCVAMLLAGIVFLNVSLLERGSGIARTSERAAALKRENAHLRQRVARLGGSERIQTLAQERGMILPAPGDVHYLKLDPKSDGRRAARRLNATAQQLASVAPSAPAPAAPPVAPVVPETATPPPATPAPQAAAPVPTGPHAAAPAPTAPQGY